jgi:pyrimidine-nucleoside phosphorylase
MNVYDIIYKKRNSGKLSPEEIRYLVEGYTSGIIPDYQMSALLMAALIRGMDNEETAVMTDAMTCSGTVLDLSDIPGVKVDKHSTGGVGDGTSLIIAPLAACNGVIVPMMSGRGLGHTGGTLDKLESIPGFNVHLDEKDYRRQLASIGAAMIGQSEHIAPADRKLYALRDVTATVDCISFISASIMSKKLSEGCDALVLDVKTGSGAFMQQRDDAKRLAETMVAIGKNKGKKVQAVITDMNQPLGNTVGNALEIIQAIDVLKGKGPADFIEVSLELTARMLVLANKENDIAAAKRQLGKCLRNGSALEKFRQIVEAQGGDSRVVDTPQAILPQAAYSKDIYSSTAGFVCAIDTRSIGLAAILIGAGRKTKEDSIDYSAGFVIHKKQGDRVEADEPLVTMYYNDTTSTNEAARIIAAAYRIDAQKPASWPLLYDEIN